MQAKKVYLEEGNRFLLTTAVVVAVAPGEIPLAIDLESIAGLASDKQDPYSESSMLVGTYLDESDADRDVFFEGLTDRFYYYAPQPPHKTYLKAGTTYDALWKSQFPSLNLGYRLDIDEELTSADENLTHTEISNDGSVMGFLFKDGVKYDVYLDHREEPNGFSHYYCYFG